MTGCGVKIDEEGRPAKKGGTACTNPTFPIDQEGDNKRSCTDKWCLFWLVLCVAIAGCIGAYAMVYGDTRRLTHGFDHMGRLCGYDQGVQDKKFLYVCGHNSWDGPFPKALDYASKSCVAECPSDNKSEVPCLTRALVNFSKLGGANESVAGHEVDFVGTLELEITQSISLQHSYASEQYRGNYCVPKAGLSARGDTLHSALIEGPLRKTAFASAIGSMRHAWWVVLIAAGVAVVLGLGYLLLLKFYAGILIYISLWVGTVLMFVLSLFFLVGIFFNPADAGFYQDLSPVFRLCVTGDPRGWSVIVAMILACSGVCTLFNTLNQNIDESIGIIQASTHCLFSHKTIFLLQPLIGGATMIVLVAVLFFIYMKAHTVEHLDASLILIDGSSLDQNQNPVEGLQREWVKDWWWDWCMTFYGFIAAWLMLLCIAISHFVTAYSVCDYYFAEGKKEKTQSSGFDAINQARAGTGKHVDNVRVHGVDRATGGRSGYIEKGPWGKVLVVPVGQPGPDGRDFIRQSEDELVKNMDTLTIQYAIAAAFTHIGSLALGAIVVTITSPLRVLSLIMKSFTANAERGSDDEEKGVSAIVVGGLGLAASFLDEFFGCYSKTLYSEIVLTSMTFWQASDHANDFVAETGGAVALLHGNTVLYEMIGVIIITSIVGAATYFTLEVIPYFGDNNEVDKTFITMLSTAIAAAIATGFMSIFNMTCDTLLYVFAWSRQSKHAAHLSELCPTHLQHLVGGEIDEEPAQALQPHTRNRLTRYSHAATKYRDTVMDTMRRGIGGLREKQPLLGSVRS